MPAVQLFAGMKGNNVSPSVWLESPAGERFSTGRHAVPGFDGEFALFSF